MSLIKWKSDDFFPRFNSIWDDFLSKDFFTKGLDLGTTIPAVNTTETEKEYKLEIAAPGLKKEDFKINLESDVLTISSEKREEKEEKDGKKITRKEFSYSSFQRSFQLPSNIKKEDIKAEYTNGILHVILPKAEITKVETKKQIEIK